MTEKNLTPTKPITIHEALELLDAVKVPRSDKRLTLEVARALDYHGYIEFKSRMGSWHSPGSTRGAVDGPIGDLWTCGREIRLSERGRGKLASIRVPME